MAGGLAVSQVAKFRRLQKFATHGNSQVEKKIRNLRNFAGCEIFATLQNSCSDPISLHFLLFFPFGF